MQSAANVAVDLFEHGALVLRVLTELRPRRVACVCPGDRFQARLADFAAALGFQIIQDPAEADVVISGASDYESVRELLAVVGDPARPAVIGGTAWPCGRRDARREIGDLPAPARARYEFRMPVPGQLALSDVRSPVAFAVTEGGPRNGVRTAIEDALSDGSGAWSIRLVQGFGGAAVLLPSTLATPERWGGIMPSVDGGDDTTLARLELANLQLRLDRERVLERLRSLEDGGAGQRVVADAADTDERLGRERARAAAWERALLAEQAARTELTQRLGQERRAAERLTEVVAELTADVRAHSAERERLVQAHGEELERVSQAYENERAFVLLQASRISESGAWRWGHRVATARAKLLFRRTRGTDAVSRLLERAAHPPAVPRSLPPAQSAATPGLQPPRGQDASGPTKTGAV